MANEHIHQVEVFRANLYSLVSVQHIQNDYLELLRLPFLHFRRQLRKNREGVADDAQVGY